MKRSNKGQSAKSEKKKKKIAADPPKKPANQESQSGDRASEVDHREWNENNPENQIVNEQEQNSPVNRQDEYHNEDRGTANTENVRRDASDDIERAEGDNIDPEHRVEGDDAGRLERKIPNL